MSTNRKTYTEEFKHEAVDLLVNSDNKFQTARELGIHISLLRKWQRKIRKNGERDFPGK